MGEMSDQKRLSRMMSLLGLCVLLAGCTPGFGLHPRKNPSPADAVAAPVPGSEGTSAGAQQVSYEDANIPAAVEAAPWGGRPANVAASEPASAPKQTQTFIAPAPTYVAPTQPPAHAPATPTRTHAAPAQTSVGPMEAVPTPRPVAAPKGVKLLPPAPNPLVKLHVDDQDVRKVLEILMRDAKVDIVASPGIPSKKLTLHFENKTLDDALAIVAKLCQLTVRRDNDVIFVLTTAEAKKLDDEKRSTRVYHLNYVKSSDMVKILTPLLSVADPKGVISQTPDAETGLPTDVQATSEEGSSGSTAAISKSGGNSLCGREIIIVQDTEEVLRRIDEIVAQVDVQPIQVLLEAVIVQVTLTKNCDLGASIAVLDDPRKVLGVAGNGSLINSAAGVDPASVITSAGKLASGFATDNYGLKIGFVGSKASLFVKALEGYGQTRVLGTPRIYVLNKQRAEIHVGDNLGYRDQTTTQTSTSYTTKFLKVGTQLRVRPFVSNDGMIRMEVRPERSTGKIDDEGIPQTSVAETTTNIMIPDGQTVVIGGMLDEETSKDWEGLPFLSRIPVVGYLFRHTVDIKTKKELIVILTPRICSPTYADAVNNVGTPRTLGLLERVRKSPLDGCKGEPENLYDAVTSPPDCPAERLPTAGRPVLQR